MTDAPKQSGWFPAPRRDDTDEERARKKTRFVWRHGVLGWGVSTAILWSVLMYVLQKPDSFFSFFLPAIVLFPLGGYAWGRWVWRKLEAEIGKPHDERS